MSLWVPDTATRAMKTERRELVGEYAQQARTLHTVREWNDRLKRIDHRLELVKAADDATLPGLRAGYWHVLRVVPGAIPGIFIHEGPNGEYMDPNSYMLERLEASDLWDDRVKKDREKRNKELRRAAERTRAQEQQERLDEFRGRMKARVNPGVLVKRDL